MNTGRLAVCLALVSGLLAGGSTAYAAAVSAMLGQEVTDLAGQPVGRIRELIVDVTSGHVVYAVVDGPRRDHTFPVRALDERLQLNMNLSGEAARLKSQGDPRFRRASRLLGLPVTEKGGEETIGTIGDIRFNAESGQVEQIVIHTGQGVRELPAAALASASFPAPTQWQSELPAEAEDLEAVVEGPVEVRRGFLVAPSDERTRLQGPPAR